MEMSDEFEIIEFTAKKGKRSFVWEFCGFVKNEGILQKSKTACRTCRHIMPYSGNTSTMANHRRRAHYAMIRDYVDKDSGGKEFGNFHIHNTLFGKYK